MRLVSARLMTHSPPATSDSLLARATRLPARSAPTVAARPAKPTMPLRTTSVGVAARRSAEPGPRRSSQPSGGGVCADSRATTSGSNSAAWVLSDSASVAAERPTTSKRSGLARTTSRAWRPILPVEPRMVRRRLTIRMCAMISYKQGDVVYRGSGKEQAVYTVEDAPVPREEMAEVLDVEDTLERRFEEVSGLGEDRDPGSDDDRFCDGEVEELERDEPDDDHRREEAAKASFSGLVRA